MKKLFFLLSAITTMSYAIANTVAGTTISNQASVEYLEASSVIKTVAKSNYSTFVVNELLDVQLIWIDTSEISVNSPDNKRALTFKLTNTGNSPQKYSLTANNNIGGGNFAKKYSMKMN